MSSRQHLPKANISFMPLTSAFDLLFDLNGMWKTLEYCHRFVPPPITQVNAFSSAPILKKNNKKHKTHTHTHTHTENYF